MENLEKGVNQSHLSPLIVKVPLMSSCKFELQSTGSEISFGSVFMAQLECKILMKNFSKLKIHSLIFT